jgi:hypothetical protein
LLSVLQAQLEAMRETEYRTRHGAINDRLYAAQHLAAQQMVFNALVLRILQERARPL